MFGYEGNDIDVAWGVRRRNESFGACIKQLRLEHICKLWEKVKVKMRFSNTGEGNKKD